jgi:PIN domain nuclease of toxin-antitoxin system
LGSAQILKKLLLDTHIWLWSLIEPHRLSPRVAKALEDASNELWLSPISIWELALLVEKGRVLLEKDFEAWVIEVVKTAGLKEAPFTSEVALETMRVQIPHRDPADRFLVATANVFGLTLVTADKRLIGAKGVSILPNR